MENILLAIGMAADRYWHDGHMDGNWWLMALAMAVFWAAIIVLVVWLVRSGGSARKDSAEEILRRRLADGSISIEEYESRRASLDKNSS